MTKTLAVLGCVLLVTGGCAATEVCPDPDEGRVISREEEAGMVAQCAPYGGCLMVPIPIFEKMIEELERKGVRISSPRY